MTTIESPFLLSKYFIDNEFLKKIGKMDDCQLGRVLDLDVKTGKIRNLLISFDEKDATYSDSGISSVEKLRTFLMQANTYIQTKNYSELSKQFHYPMFIYSASGTLKIKNQNDFISNKSLIITNKFVELINKNINKESFEKMPRGLMLTSGGEYWVIGVNSELLFEVNGGIAD